MSRFTKTAALAALSVMISLGVAWSLDREAQTKEIPVSSGGLLALNLESGGDVEIVGADVSAAKVEYSVHSDETGYYDIVVNPMKGGLEIKTVFKRHVSQSHGVDFKITLPRAFNAEWKSMGGGFTLENLEGSFSGRTNGGGLTLRGVRGRARLVTMGGDITLTDSELDGSLRTMGGEVLFRNVTGDVSGSSSGGLIRYENVRDRSGRFRAPERISESGLTSKTVVISTMGGEIEVDQAPEGAKVHTLGGPVRIVNARKFVQATTMGGDITIKVNDGWINATTMAGDITADVATGVGGGDEGIRLESMSGDIVLTVPAGLPVKLDLTIVHTKNSDHNYRIISDFPVQEERTQNWEYEGRGRDDGSARKYIFGKSSGGTIEVKIRTVNGNITVRKGRDHGKQ